jgi:STE24 endopeptidase
MNPYSFVILSALLIEFALDRLSDVLDLKRLAPHPPEEFGTLIDSDRHLKSVEYTRVRTRFGAIVSGFDLSVLLAFWFSGGFDAADRFVRSRGLPVIPTGLAFIGILLFARFLLSLPFSVHQTFVIESRFGFNRTTPATFVADRIKGLMLALVLAGPLLTALMALFQHAGPRAWAVAWALAAAFSLAVQFIAPAVILPLFNRFTPLPEGELRRRILDYARSVGFPLKEVQVMDGSRRSGKSNAFFTGFGKNKRIALYDTLIEKQTTPEMIAILAHEIGHYRLKHVPQGIAIGVLHSGVLLFGMSLLIGSRGLFDAFYMQNGSVYAGFFLSGLLFAPAEFVFSLFLNALSRRNETRADRFAADTTGDPEALVSALKKLSVDNLSNLTPHPLSVLLHDSHPPVQERIRRLKHGG